MAPSTSPTTGVDAPDSDGWPWPCLDCGRTIFHDSDYCRDCDSARAGPEPNGRLPAARGFGGWMRREPYPTFVLKIALISGTELALTALWLHVTLVGPSALLRGAPLFA